MKIIEQKFTESESVFASRSGMPAPSPEGMKAVRAPAKPASRQCRNKNGEITAHLNGKYE